MPLPMNYGGMRRWADVQNWIGGRMGQADQRMDPSRNAYAGAITQMQGFDPSQYMRQASGAIYNNMSRDFGLAEQQRKAGLNRRGLVSDIGGFQAQNRYFDALANSMNGLAMQTGQMVMDRDRGVTGAYADMYGRDTDQSNMYFDALYGATASRKAQDFQEKEGRRNRKTALIGGALGAVGSVASAALPIRYR